MALGRVIFLIAGVTVSIRAIVLAATGSKLRLPLERFILGPTEIALGTIITALSYIKFGAGTAKLDVDRIGIFGSVGPELDVGECSLYRPLALFITSVALKPLCTGRIPAAHDKGHAI